MKKTTFFLIALLAITNLNAQIKIKPEVTAVKLYFSGAEITQYAKVKLNNANTLVFTGLSEGIHDNTVSVKATNARILSVSNRLNYIEPYEEDERVISLKRKIDSLNNMKITLLAKIAELDNRINFLKNISNAGNLTFNELKKLADYYNKESRKIYDRMVVEKKQSKELDELIMRYKKQLQELGNNGNKVNEIIVEVADAGETAEFEIKYFTTAAGWKPEYNLRANGSNENTQLTLKAIIKQNTGLAWNGIPLSLSSRILNQSNEKPELPVWWLIFYSPAPMMRMKTANAEFSTPAKPEFDLASVTENQFDFEFMISSCPQINSGNKDKSLVLKSYELKGEYKYTAVPKLSEYAFLVTEIKDWSKLHLIPGQINLFYDDVYVGKSYLRTNTAQDKLTLSLGKDNNIILSRKVIKDYTESIMLSSDVKRFIEIAIELKNNKGSDVELTVEDNIPVSKNEDIIVEPGNLSGAKLNSGDGKLYWNVKLKAGEKKIINYSFLVRYPGDKNIGGL